MLQYIYIYCKFNQQSMKKLIFIIIPIILVTATILALKHNLNQNKLETTENSMEYAVPDGRQWVFSNQNFEKNNDEIKENNDNNSPKVETIIEKPHELTISAWIVYWDLNRGIETVINNKDIFTSASPVWYAVNPDGTLALKTTARNNKLRDEFKQNNIPIIPTIADFNADNLSIILNSPTKRTQHINYIVNEVNTYDYDGIDIDYED